MIEINHNKQIGAIKTFIGKLDEVKLNVNVGLIEKDINRLKNELSTSKNKYDKKNITALIEYLKKVKKYVDKEDGTLTLCWTTNIKGEPSTYPVTLLDEPLYKISTINYIEVASDSKIVIINIEEIADAIAYELMYRDLCDELDDIEDRLQDCKLVGFNDLSKLTAKFKADGDKMYYLSKTMKIDDTPYMHSEDKTVLDYFLTKEFKADSYREVVTYSCKSAAEVIAHSLLKGFSSFNVKADLIMTEPTCVACIVEDVNGAISEANIDDISVLVFGRKFKLDRNYITIL